MSAGSVSVLPGSGPTRCNNGTSSSLLSPTISDRAMLYGASLKTADATLLASRLYGYNRLPTALTEWSQNTAAHYYLGVADSRRSPQMWRRERDEDRKDWISWRHRYRQSKRREMFKLYLCILPGDLPRVLGDCLEILGNTGSHFVKIGSDRASLSRPDKFVAYFDSKEDLDGSVAALDILLAGLDPHELPFAAMLPNPVLAWGIDPDRKRIGSEQRSWRTWVVEKVTQALCAAHKSTQDPNEAVSFAHRCLAEAGLDPQTMTPRSVTFE